MLLHSDSTYFYDEGYVMEVFVTLFNDATGWLTMGIIVFMLVMMGYLSTVFFGGHSDL